jgi:hypothetical protein
MVWDMLVRLVIAVLLIAGPIPFRSCACEADHHATGPTTTNHTEHHDPDCPMANPPHPKPALTVANIEPDLAIGPIAAPIPFVSPWPVVERESRLPLDNSRPRWLMHLAIQI